MARPEDGNTVGTLICENFECSRNLRKLPPLAYEGFDREAARDQRIEELQIRSAALCDRRLSTNEGCPEEEVLGAPFVQAASTRRGRQPPRSHHQSRRNSKWQSCPSNQMRSAQSAR
ncbi:FBP domain-containing protein [Pseudoclavibacter albus]|uniref:FBP domain-containing protein n=1 Tax=Pseudoclavibacter albus TaxID=272241 RepID=UPI0030B96307